MQPIHESFYMYCYEELLSGWDEENILSFILHLVIMGLIDQHGFIDKEKIVQYWN